MEKIDFKDLPDTTTPFTASIFNEMQDNIETAINTNDIYSTDEIVIGKWLGKPLYRKVYDVGTLPDSTTKLINSGLSNINIVKIYGTATEEIGTYIPLPYVTLTDIYQISLVYNSSNQISITTGTNRSQFTGFVVLEYTKTTD